MGGAQNMSDTDFKTQINAWLAASGLEHAQAAKKLDVNIFTLQNWIYGKSVPGASFRRVIEKRIAPKTP